jgi:hypothetical protein
MEPEKKMKCYADYLKTYLPSSTGQAKLVEDHRLLGEEYAAKTISRVRENDKPKSGIERA